MMDNREKMNKLLDAYECLLTEHQVEVMKMYYEDDFSLQEISDEVNSSRSAVSDLIKRVEKILIDYESKLHLVEKEETTYVMIMTACDDMQIVEKIKKTLLDEHLAPCVQVVDMKSNYRWKGEMYDENEKLLLIKTRRNKYEEIERRILEIHNYDVCEISMVNIEDGSKDYLEWIDEEVGE